MKFNAVNQLTFDKNASIAEEASGEVQVVNQEGQSMNVSLITDKIIEENGLQPVTSPFWFKKGSIPTDDGLLSPIIFGDTPQERMRNHAYIDLKRKFFHPYVFEVLARLYTNFKVIAMGQGVWKLDDNGYIVEVKDKDDKDYDEDNTGIGWLVDNFSKMKFKETSSLIRKQRLELIGSLTEDEIFISKWIVIPIFYRDYDASANSVPDINYMYRTLIENANSLGNEILGITKNLTMNKIQNQLVEIRKFGQGIIEKKHGAFQKTILGKAQDFGGRGVISVPSLNGCDVPNDCIVDITHSGVPLSYCISLGYPFMIKWITEFFEDTFRNKRTVPVYRKNKKGEVRLENVEIVDQTEIFTKDFIDKKLEMYMKTFGAERFETVKIKCKDGSEAEMLFTGTGYARNAGDPRSNSIGNRPMTWTDIIYLAAENSLSDKYCYITRYPLLDYFGTFPSQIAVLSTIKTAPVIIEGKVYPHYPVIDLSLSPKDIATQFIDTISISNLYLDAIGGD